MDQLLLVEFLFPLEKTGPGSFDARGRLRGPVRLEQWLTSDLDG